MYLVAAFGFALVAGGVSYAIRPSARVGRLVLLLGILTLGAGFFGTFTGMCTTFNYLQGVEASQQVRIMAMGLEESLHNAVFALVLVLLSGLGGVVGAARTPARLEA